MSRKTQCFLGAGKLGCHAKYFADTPVRDIGLLASEGRFTIPLTDASPAGVLDIQSHFFEFIPENEINSTRPTPRSLPAPASTLSSKSRWR